MLAEHYRERIRCFTPPRLIVTNTLAYYGRASTDVVKCFITELYKVRREEMTSFETGKPDKTFGCTEF